MSTHNIPFPNMKKKNHPKFSQICSYGIFQGTQEPVQNSRRTRAISVRAIEVLLYTDTFIEIFSKFFSLLCSKSLLESPHRRFSSNTLLHTVDIY